MARPLCQTPSLPSKSGEGGQRKAELCLTSLIKLAQPGYMERSRASARLTRAACLNSTLLDCRAVGGNCIWHKKRSMSDKRGPDAQRLRAARLAEAEPWGLSPERWQSARLMPRVRPSRRLSVTPEKTTTDRWAVLAVCSEPLSVPVNSLYVADWWLAPFEGRRSMSPLALNLCDAIISPIRLLCSAP